MHSDYQKIESTKFPGKSSKTLYNESEEKLVNISPQWTTSQSRETQTEFQVSINFRASEGLARAVHYCLALLLL